MKSYRSNFILVLLIQCIILSLFSCGDDDTSAYVNLDNASNITNNQNNTNYNLFNNGKPNNNQNGEPNNNQTENNLSNQSSNNEVSNDTVNINNNENNSLTCYTDEDRDGSYALECGGFDCDDTNPYVAPGNPEYCDFLDNNCNNIVNETIQCWFYAHTSDMLYRIDPFSGQIAYVTSIPNILDFDTHPDGTLYGIGYSDGQGILYSFDAISAIWNQVGLTDVYGVGFAINNYGNAFITSEDKLYSIDLETAESTFLSVIGDNVVASGDCVVNKDNSLFMTSKHTETDSLVFINGTSSTGTIIGETGFSKIFGLTAAWGMMFGVTATGDLIIINESTGESTLLYSYPELSWYGAASTPSR